MALRHYALQSPGRAQRQSLDPDGWSVFVTHKLLDGHHLTRAHLTDILPTGFSVAQKAWDLLSEKERQLGGLSALVIGCGPVGLCVRDTGNCHWSLP